MKSSRNKRTMNKRMRNKRTRNQRMRNKRTRNQRGGASLMVGVVLDNKSQEYLKSEEFDHAGFLVHKSCHHVTIRFGKGILPGDPSVGTPVKIVCERFGLNGQAKALKVASMTTLDEPMDEQVTFANDDTNNNVLHITVRHLGPGDAAKSNDITDWSTTLSKPVVLYGKVSLATDFKWSPNNFNDMPDPQY
jgi:hypothetical protein